METKLKSRTGNFFEVVVKVLQTQEDGSEKKVREVYAIEASSFTEAEAIITEEMKLYKEYDIVNININDENFFKAKLEFFTVDEKTEKEKRTKVVYLVQASSIKTAQHYIENIMGSVQLDYRNVAIVESPVLDVQVKE